MEPTKDKRVSDHLANERTFLAWIRTSIGIMAFGFVVVRFSLFVKQLTTILDKDKLASSALPAPEHGHSAFIGIVLVASGLLTTLFAFFRFKKTQTQIESSEYRSSTPLIWLVTAFIVLVSVLLIVYLLQIT
jgi:putative membrane protein